MKKTITILFLFFVLSSGAGFSQSLQNDVAVVTIKNTAFETLRKRSGSAAYSSYIIEEWMKNKKPAKTVLGYTKQNHAVEAYYFPGTSSKKALIIGGMHGSELPSIEIAKKLVDFLSTGELPYYNVIVVPILFPDNAERALQSKQPESNLGRYTTKESVDPNRQMPALGKAFRKNNPLDVYGRVIEKENQFLLQLIQDYEPSRIVNLHAIKDVTKAGIYADPRTDCKGSALGFETDSSLAVSMASFIETNGGSVPGNYLQKTPTALYYHDPEIVNAGFLQKRNLHGSPMPGNRGYGVSLGGWATTGVCDETYQRNAARLITIEFPGYLPSWAYDGQQKERCILNIQLYAWSLRKIFLDDSYVE